MGILLTDEEIEEVEILADLENKDDYVHFWLPGDTMTRVAKAQLKKVIEYFLEDFASHLIEPD